MKGYRLYLLFVFVFLLAGRVALMADSIMGDVLNEVVITATRTPKLLKDVPVVTRLISSAEIEHVDPVNVQDLLTQELPGLEFGYAMSQETSLNMGGFGGNAVLFLVDGERMAGETMDNVDYNRLILDNIGHVEIVKGASSALYGANAVGGVVNLITRESKDPWHVTLSSRYGNFTDEWRTDAVVNFNSKHWNSGTSFQYRTAKTVRLTDRHDAISRMRYIYGGDTWNARERLVYRVNDNLRFIARGAFFYRTSDRVDYVDHYKDYAAGIRGMYDFDATNNLELSYSFDRYDKLRYVGGVRTNAHDYSNRQNIVHALYTKFWGLNGLTVGADYMHDYLTTYQFEEGEYHSQVTVDGFAQFDYNPLSWLNVIASVRNDYYSASKSNAVTSRVAFMFRPKPVIVRLSYAGGFRAPTLKEMFMTFDMASVFIVLGNPDLRPEKSHNFNLSFERDGKITSGFLRGSYNLSATCYFNYYDSRIVTVEVPYDSPIPAIKYFNEDGVTVYGADLTGRYYTDFGLGASISYNYYHATGQTVDSEFIQPRPHSATWKLDYEKQLMSFWRIYAAISGRYLGNPITIYENHGPYNIWKFTMQHTFLSKYKVNFTIDNLFNYKPQYYFWNSPLTLGTSINIGVSIGL